MATYTAPRRLYVNEARDTVVEENDPAARFLLVAEGGELPEEEARRLGLLDAPTEPAATESTQAGEGSDETVSELLDRADGVDDPAELQRILDAEEAGKGRKTAVEGLRSRLSARTQAVSSPSTQAVASPTEPAATEPETTPTGAGSA